MALSVRNVTYKQRNQVSMCTQGTWKMSYDHTSFTLRQRAPCSQEHSTQTEQQRVSSKGKQERVHPPPTPKPCFFVKVNTSKTETLAVNRILYVYEAKTQSQTRMCLDQEPPCNNTPHVGTARRARGCTLEPHAASPGLAIVYMTGALIYHSHICKIICK